MRDLFRSIPWVDAWIDTWGRDRRINLIDLGGDRNPLEMVYIIKHRLKGVLPIKCLALAGSGCYELNTPRAEYNNLNSLIAMAGGLIPLGKELSRFDWSQFSVADICSESITVQALHEISATNNWYPCVDKMEIAYSVSPGSFDQYLASLGPNTRSIYFNRRHRLEKIGEIELFDCEAAESDFFFKTLNLFHIPRWGRPCYSKDSISFMTGFVERVIASGGNAILQVMKVNGEVVSAIYDIEWNGVRYNLQSGYKENRFAKIALGSIHFGYAIEEAQKKGFVYDFMAGMGKSNNYKKHIANTETVLKSYLIIRGFNKYLYRFYGK